MAVPPRRARDLALVDALDLHPLRNFVQEVWRVAKAGRDPLSPSRSKGRWSDGSFDVLYTSLERDGAIAEIHALLSLQPVLPSRDAWFVHRLRVSVARVLDIAAMERLTPLGIDPDRYGQREYGRTQAIGEAAFFLGADGVLAPSARWSCVNFVAFTERLGLEAIELVETLPEPIDWAAWRREKRS